MSGIGGGGGRVRSSETIRASRMSHLSAAAAVATCRLELILIELDNWQLAELSQVGGTFESEKL